MMRSHLTRLAFHHILRGEPLSHLHCTSQSVTLPWRQQSLAWTGPRVKTRSLFGFSRKPPREAKTTNLDPGYGLMMDLSNLLRMNARPPPAPKLVVAFRDFFTARRKSPRPLEDIQASLAMVTFKHLQETNSDEAGFGLSIEDLQTALKALVYRRTGPESGAREQLARLLFAELMSRRNSHGSKGNLAEFCTKTVTPFIQIMSQCGRSLDARETLEQYWQTDLEQAGHLPWKFVLKGFAKEQNDEELLRTVEIMQKHGVPFDSKVHQSITITFARSNDLVRTRTWYMHPIVDGSHPTSRTNVSVLRLCIFHKDFEWGQFIFETVLERQPDKESWDVILQWAAAKGKGVDEIERMMEVMVRRNEEQGSKARPDIETINGLIELANAGNDSYTAERYVALAQKWNIHLDARTFLLQLDYRLKIGDIDGARFAYTQLQAYEIPDNKDVPLVNKLILALCHAKRQDYEAIMAYVEDLSERKARFEPETVSALCTIHLHRNELHDLIDLLQTHAFHYGMDQRAFIRDVFVDFCLDRSTSTSRAWDAYSILRQIFGETGSPIRLKLMNEFFSRGRSDMAMHVFGHMRQQAIHEKRPDTNAYAQCLEGIAKSRDLGSLETVHNMLKLDSEVEPDTKLYNALMLGYTACGEPRRSLEFWDDIVYSREGPTYNSIRIALKACEVAPFGERQARDIWGKLQRFEIEVTKEIYEAYIGALAGRALFKEALQLIDDMEVRTGYKPDDLTWVHSYRPL